MAKSGKPGKDSKIESDSLVGWKNIAEFLGQPVAVAQGWGRSGMPVKRTGRFIVASGAELNEWLGRELGGEPVHLATQQTDLSEELKRGLAYLRKGKKLPVRGKGSN